jgi:hypothetical protein
MQIGAGDFKKNAAIIDFIIMGWVIILIFFLIPFKIFAQSLTGTTGYYNIPSAEIYRDKSMFFGCNLLNKEYKKWGSPDYHAMDFFVTTSYFPFFEVSVRFTRMIDMPSSAYESTNGDRMASARVRIFRESKYYPAILVGLQNFFTTLESGDASHFNSTYLVATKNFEIHKIIHHIGLTAGYGSNILKAADYQFIGWFGGIKITPQYLKCLELMFEYDADKWNAGARVTILKHIILLAGYEGLDAFSGGVSYRFMLP